MEGRLGHYTEVCRMGFEFTPVGRFADGTQFRPVNLTQNPRGASEESQIPKVTGFESTRLLRLKFSVQFHLERSVRNSGGQVVGRGRVDVSLRMERYELDALAWGEEDADVTTPLQSLQNYFSADRTAERIATFVRDGFSRTSFGGVNTEESRSAFVEFIMPYIRRGVDEAIALFGDDLPEEIQDRAEETYGRTLEILREFVAPSTLPGPEGGEGSSG